MDFVPGLLRVVNQPAVRAHSAVFHTLAGHGKGLLEPVFSERKIPIFRIGWVRGRRCGSWFTEGSKTRSACRDWFGPSFRGSTIGFRVVCIPLDE